MIVHRYDGNFVECITCAVNNSIQTSIAMSFFFHIFSFDGNWDTVVPMDDLDILPEFKNSMAHLTRLGLQGGFWHERGNGNVNRGRC